MPDTDDMAIFVRIIELGSLSAAGRDMRLSPAVVSNRVARLEGSLGVRLLNRTTRRVSPTEEGATSMSIACRSSMSWSRRKA